MCVQPGLPISLKLIHTRVYAQGLTLGVLFAAAAIEG